jgi:subtilisin-like proprotein convertase family protein
MLSGGGHDPFEGHGRNREGRAHINVVMDRLANPASVTPPGSALTPAQVRGAYGLDQVMFGAVQGDGAGQTIAIVDAYDYPTALADLQAFDAQFGLPDPPSFKRVAQDGSTNFPPTDPAGAGNPNGTWELEAALDIEWAHAMAPAANILLVEANDNSFANLVQGAVNWVRSQPGVVAVSMSFGGGEFFGETSFDPIFTTPGGHGGVTFLAATGDAGQPGGYPAYSPNVVAVGGTTLSVSGTTYLGESGWAGSGGGISTQENKPAYQNGVVTQSATRRTNPDVSMDADPVSGVAVYDSYDFGGSPWVKVGGTSLATPLFAGVIAVADQGRALAGLGSLDGATQTLPKLYALPASDFHDETTGNNGFAAGPGYDLVTGRGSPVGNLLIPDLVGAGSISGTVYEDRNSSGSHDVGEPGIGGATVYLDSNNNGTLDAGATANVVSTNVPKSIPDNNATGTTSNLTLSGLAGALTHVAVTFSITHPRDADLTIYLIAPDGTPVKLVSGLTGANFTNTTLDDSAATSIASALAPYTGTFQPNQGTLASFNGKMANGTWGLKVVDGRRNNTGTLVSWSISVTTAGELSAVTGANGAYTLGPVTSGTYTVREVTPAGYLRTTAAADIVNVTGNTGGADFGNFPTVIAASGNGTVYTVSLDASIAFVRIAMNGTPTYQIALASLPGLTFNLLGANEAVYVDFTNGSPIPAGNINVNGTAGEEDELRIMGTGFPPSLDMTDTQIGPSGGTRAIVFADVATMSLFNCTVFYAGELTTLENLILGVGALFHWQAG